MEELDRENERLNNTKETQTLFVYTKDVSTQTDIPVYVDNGTQVGNVASNDQSETEDEIGELDSSTQASQTEIESSSESESEIDYSEDKKPSGAAFIVFWSSLQILLQRCLSCASTAIIKKVIVKGSALTVHMSCLNDHFHIWRSQPMQNRFYLGNLKLIAAVLFSSNTYTKLKKYFEMLDIPWISKAWYYRIHKNYLVGITNEAWQKEQRNVISILNQRESFLCGDGRCDTPGHNAKYLTYSLFEQNIKKIIVMSTTQVTEAGNSNRMEKMGLIKVLQEAKSKLYVKQLTTDRHVQIKKYMREQEKEIDHQFDVWHFSKSIKIKLLHASKRKRCEQLKPWIKSICNHLWWACATCNQDQDLLKEKWTSIVFHIQNKHQWTGNFLYHECSHEMLSKEVERKKAWLSPTSEAFQSLQAIVFDKTILRDMGHLTKFSHTGVLEVYHSLLNKWAPKSTHFSYQGMVARAQLAAIDFNLGSYLEHAKTKDGEDRYNVTFSKMTGNWSAKPIKEKKCSGIFMELIDRTVYAVVNGEHVPCPEIPDLPKNIAVIPKPEKKEVIKNQKSRFTVV